MTRALDNHGTHAQALEFALNVHDDTLYTYEFLKAWSEGALDEWPEFCEWLDRQPAAPLEAAPAYIVGSIVLYTDRHQRLQQGRVRGIKASWAGYAKPDRLPLIIYRLEHPTYQNGQFYTTAENILGPVEVPA